MKMKKACSAAALTERAVRLYLKKGLLSPQQTDGFLDFSEADVQRLKDIALLRQHDFSLEQLAAMLRDPAVIPDTFQLRIRSACTASAHEQEVHARLGALDPAQLSDLHAAAEQLRLQCAPPPCPDFGRFDEISDERRAEETVCAAKALSAAGQEKTLRHRLMTIAAILAAFLVLSAIFLGHTRISGFISTGRLAVETVYGTSATVTFCNQEVAALLGQDAATLPYHIFSIPLKSGDVIERGCQLAVELTNFDLLRLGISPLQSFRTSSEALNDQWMTLILHALFQQDPASHAALWINDICNLPPLFSWKP